ncbi:MAG TPA: hypothetical protein VHZ26_07370 [Caulobacteraceae bacterium]|jgi:type III secretory pathway component EscS|nr:hypothetical protein [Caulobacteraceae bacterium]
MADWLLYGAVVTWSRPLIEAAASLGLARDQFGVSDFKMTLPFTLALLVVFVAVTVLCGWMGARPRDYSKPRMVPWQFLMLLSAAVTLIMIVGVLNELGVTTGANR